MRRGLAVSRTLVLFCREVESGRLAAIQQRRRDVRPRGKRGRGDGKRDDPGGPRAILVRAMSSSRRARTGEDDLPHDPFLLLHNGWWELDFTVPEPLRAIGWQIEVDMAGPGAAGRAVDPSAALPLSGRSLMLLRDTRPKTEPQRDP